MYNPFVFIFLFLLHCIFLYCFPPTFCLQSLTLPPPLQETCKMPICQRTFFFSLHLFVRYYRFNSSRIQTVALIVKFSCHLKVRFSVLCTCSSFQNNGYSRESCKWGNALQCSDFYASNLLFGICRRQADEDANDQLIPSEYGTGQ